jgi:hypothetical protein
MVKIHPPTHQHLSHTITVERSKSRMCQQFLILSFLLVLLISLDQPIISKYTIHLNTITTTTTAKQNTGVIPQHEIIDGIDVLWTAPPTTTRSPCGILFLAHGCSHSHTDWFANCGKQNCLGLPEEVAIVQFALERNLIVVAISSTNRWSKCWQLTQDGPRVVTVLNHISKRYPIDAEKKNLPIFAFGASSGGAFVTGLGRYMKLDGFWSQISANPNPEPVDCMVYLTMNKDDPSDKAAAEIVATAKHGKHIQLPALLISSPSFFSERIPNLPMSRSTSIVNSLKKDGYIDDVGFLLQDPRQSDWRLAVRQFSGSDNLIADESPLSEVMNVAYGMHEMTRDGVLEGFDFCLQLQTKQSCNAK